jgi:hypothetical protein
MSTTTWQRQSPKPKEFFFSEIIIFIEKPRSGKKLERKSSLGEKKKKHIMLTKCYHSIEQFPNLIL